MLRVKLIEDRATAKQNMKMIMVGKGWANGGAHVELLRNTIERKACTLIYEPRQLVLEEVGKGRLSMLGFTNLQLYFCYGVGLMVNRKTRKNAGGGGVGRMLCVCMSNIFASPLQIMEQRVRMHKIDIPYIVYQETKTGLFVHETRRYE